MNKHVNGQTLWEAIKEKFFSIGDQHKLIDGAKVMVGKKKGFIGYLTQHIDVPSFHCIIHQQALFAKNLCLNDVMKIRVQIINYKLN